MDENPVPADAVTAEREAYAAVVSEFRGLRQAGAGLIEAAMLTAAHLTIINAASES